MGSTKKKKLTITKLNWVNDNIWVITFELDPIWIGFLMVVLLKIVDFFKEYDVWGEYLSLFRMDFFYHVLSF